MSGLKTSFRKDAVRPVALNSPCRAISLRFEFPVIAVTDRSRGPEIAALA